ncbi:MAG: hypothetical protein FWC95_05885 [Defluviitaleaceae bacterium]|nr:hypothetical protein [Defluviitaleaceae bacterium]
MGYQGCIIAESLRDTSVLAYMEITETNVYPVTERNETPWLDQWTMYTVSVAAKHADSVAERVAAALETEHTGSWYADFKNDTHHYVIFSERVFKLDRTNKADRDKMNDYASSLGLPEHQMLRYSGT